MYIIGGAATESKKDAVWSATTVILKVKDPSLVGRDVRSSWVQTRLLLSVPGKRNRTRSWKGTCLVATAILILRTAPKPKESQRGYS